MGPIEKGVVYGLAAVGGVTVLALMLARFATISLYSPTLNMDLIKVRGSTLAKLLVTGGGDSEPQTPGGIPFPIAVRVRLFDNTPSMAELAYSSFTGKQWNTGQLLK